MGRRAWDAEKSGGGSSMSVPTKEMEKDGRRRAEIAVRAEFPIIA